MLTQENIAKIQKLYPQAQVRNKIGQNLLGTLYEIVLPQYGVCALKLLEGKAAGNPKFLKKFLQGVVEARKVKNPRLAAIYELGEEEIFFVLREFVAGESLQQKLEANHKFSPVQATQVILDAAVGLEAASVFSVVHKNLKPGNLIVPSDGQVKLVDCSLPPTSPHYLSPEQCEGKKSDIRSDIYSLGAIYYTCLAGQTAYGEGSAKEIMEAHLARDCPDLCQVRLDVPAGVGKVVRRMMARQPEDRPRDYQELIGLLHAVLESLLGSPVSQQQKQPGKTRVAITAKEAMDKEQTIALVQLERPGKVDEARLLKFKQVASDMANKLRTVNQALQLVQSVRESQDEATLFLDEMLRFITLKTGEFLRADRAIVFFVDEERGELWAIMEQGEAGTPLEMRIPMDEGITGEVVATKRVVNIPFDFYTDPRSHSRHEIDAKTQYRTYSMLALPLLDRQGGLIAILQLLNKLQEHDDPQLPLADRIDRNGFDDQDIELFEEFAPSMQLILESSRSFYKAIQSQRAAAALIAATYTLSHSNLDLGQTLSRVMDEAKKLMNADRSTLWLVDKEKKELWTRLPMADGTVKEIRMPKNSGFVGQVAESGQPLIIPFDLYSQANSTKAKEMDQLTGYRTCSMLCMPIFNNSQELIGVTQLINKKRQGEVGQYRPADWPKAPECWKASFNRSDMEFMKAFNIQAGVALENAKLFATIQQQEQMQRDILRSLTNGVISTDKTGKVIAANDSAKRLLGFPGNTHVEGQQVREIIKIQDGDFGFWLDGILGPSLSRPHHLYYPEQTLVSHSPNETHSVHLTINSIANVSDPSLISGALVVLDDISDEKRVKNMMYRYMTQEVAEKLLASGTVSLGGKVKEVSVLFSDIRSYTTLTEGMSAENVVAMLNEYFEQMVDAVFRFKGTLDKYIGDAIMAVFGAPLPLEDHSWCAVQTALEMRRRLQQFNLKRQFESQKPIKIGIGINSGQVVSGNIGSSKRMELTVIGDGVNLASRLEGTTKYYGCDIVISEYTYRYCRDRVWSRELDFITVKGKTEPVRIYELLGLRTEPLPAHKTQQTEIYAQARELYQKREFAQAAVAFNKVLTIAPGDLAAELHIERCHHFIQQPPADNWDGVWKLTEK